MVLSEAASRDELTSMVNERLCQLVPGWTSDDALNRCIRHSLLAPGKRLRPAMLLLTVEALGGCPDDALDTACAMEMVHTASLMVDDLPCMDDAELRRGRPSSHRRFGVATALLAAVSLLNRAPAVIADSEGLDADLKLRLIRRLAAAVGSVEGLTAGQTKDLSARGGATGLDRLDRIVVEKTAALFVCCVESGALIAGADNAVIAGLRHYATSFGRSYQILDDVLDQVASSATLRKDVGQDDAKTTFATVFGQEAARQMTRRHAEAAIDALEDLGLADSRLAGFTQWALPHEPN